MKEEGNSDVLGAEASHRGGGGGSVSPPGSKAMGGVTTEWQNNFPAPLSGGFAHENFSLGADRLYCWNTSDTCRCEMNLPELNMNDQGSARILDRAH